ncbi:6-bladed beta-propeller [Paenibacillus sp. BSR1-1]|uniref:6-bladed beta-propeller n=1 Tax=Paenibacillus sp. BSR1-1 TaxID=3020845 RepID=UPI0025B021E3|nr:6-bladed beta-propeller [Paenibacillus sp. BSR1-1]MDN3019035.1 6-bladed beta-propeller [Paenibacillus sp. BSR1-1]
MKKRTVYILMSSIVALSVAFFAAIYFFNLESTIKPIVAKVDPSGPPIFTNALYGEFNAPLNKPMDVTKIGEFVYVSDTNNKQVQVFDQSGTSVFKFGKEGTKEGEFKFPYGIAGDKDGNVYVADLYNANISIFDSKGKFLKYFNDKEKLLKSPGGLRIVDKKLYVTDIKANKLFVFNLSGEKLLEIGGAGMEEGKFIAPNAVAVDNDDHIYVTDSGNNRVQVFDKSGKFIKIINGSKDGKGDPTFLNPRGVAVDSKGNVFVVNNLAHNIYAFDKNGKELYELGGMGTENDKLYLPNGLFIDDRDTLFVTDTINQRVSVFY